MVEVRINWKYYWRTGHSGGNLEEGPTATAGCFDYCSRTYNEIPPSFSISVDQLALHSIDIVYFPTSWWSEAQDHVDFSITAVNYGMDIPAQDYIYNIQQYFSVDDILDPQTDVWLSVRMLEGGHYYEQREAMPSGQLVTSPVLTGGSLSLKLKHHITQVEWPVTPQWCNLMCNKYLKA